MKDRTRGAIRHLDLLWQAGSLAGLSDGQLLTHATSEDHNAAAVAFEALVYRHGPMVLATCRGVLRHEQDAEDAFQATFLVLARRAGSLRRSDRLGPWLHRVALRASGQVRAGLARRRDREAHGAGLSDMVEPEPERELEREELRRVVHEEIDRLPERYRKVVILCELQGESYETAATRLGVPVGTVRSRLSRARERLRLNITRRGMVVPAGLAFLAVGKASAALPPAHLVGSTVKLATLATAGGFAALPAGVTGLEYAQNVLKASSLIALGKPVIVVAVVGLGLTVAGVGASLRRNHPPAMASDAPAAPNPVVTSKPSQPTESNKDAEWLRGRWVVHEAEQRGQPLDIVAGDRLDIEDGRFRWTAYNSDINHMFARRETRGRITLEPTADPRRLELIIEAGRTIRGLYRLSESEQRLLLCLGDPDKPDWPREFASEPNSRQLLLVFRRDGPPGRHIE
jgi:RNA polymerase sigma factor (sigma-70 family)